MVVSWFHLASDGETDTASTPPPPLVELEVTEIWSSAATTPPPEPRLVRVEEGGGGGGARLRSVASLLIHCSVTAIMPAGVLDLWLVESGSEDCKLAIGFELARFDVPSLRSREALQFAAQPLGG